jgi:NAD(P) transhydrogenase subunit alpha
MKIFVPNESAGGESRVALVPATVKRLIAPGVEVFVETQAGALAGSGDEAYRAAGASIASSDGWEAADVVVTVAAPAEGQIRLMRSGAVLVGMLSPHRFPERISVAAEKGVSALALEYVPRITRAQAMDVLSSQANIAGYKSVILAAEHSPRVFPMMMTAAGTIRPAKALVIGAGVAGLQAIATARRLGAVVSAYDVRPAVKEQVQSLGAKFVELPLETAGAQDAGGYARELSADQQEKQRALMAQVIAESDVVITTAAIPGKPAPKLISEEVVHRMTAGSVIVDLAADSGGNCACTKPGETLHVNGVTIVGTINIPGTVPLHSSQMYSNNLLNLLKLIIGPEGAIKLDTADEIIAGILLCRDGQIVHPRMKELLNHA